MKCYRRFVLFIVFVMYTVVFGTRISIGVTLPTLIKEFGISNTEAGALSGFFFVGYFLTQVPAGFWIARYGSRNLVGMAMSLMSLFLWLFGSMTTLAWAGWYRLGLGITQGPISVGGNSIIGQWFPLREQSRAISVMVASTMLAPILFPPVCSWVIAEWGWRSMFKGFAIISLILSSCWGYFIRSCPEQSDRCSSEELAAIRSPVFPVNQSERKEPMVRNSFFYIKTGTVRVIGCKSTLLKSRDLWWMTLSYFFFVSVFYGIITWLPSYFIHSRGMDLMSMGWLVAVPWVGALTGSLVGGWVVDHWLAGNPLPVITWGSLMTAVSLFLFYTAPQTLSWTISLLMVIGFFVGLTPAGYMTYPIRLAARDIYPVGMSVMNSGGNIGGLLAPLMSGILLDRVGSYSSVFVYFIVCAMLAAVISLMIRRPVD